MPYLAPQSIGASFMAAADAFIRFLPSFVGALALLIIGWLLATGLGRILVKGLHFIGFERAVQATGIGPWLSRINPKWTASLVLGALVRWFLFLLFVVAATNLLNIPQVTHVVDSVILFIPQVVVAIAIVVIGAWAARLVGNAVRASLARIDGVDPALFARITQFAILGVAMIAAISQLGIAPFVVNSLFIALVGALALAVGLAFGLGGRDVAARITQRWYETGQRVADHRRPVNLGPGPGPVVARPSTRAYPPINTHVPPPPAGPRADAP